MDSLIFVAAKLVGAAVRPDSWLILGLALAFLATLRGWVRLSTGALGVTLAFALTMAILPLGTLLLAPLEARHPIPPMPDRIDGIVVLGGGEDLGATRRWGGVQLGQAAERLATAVALARQHPEATVLFAGGSGRLRDLTGAELSEATVAARFFAEQGLDPGRLRFEDSSRNTAENARRSRALADPAEGETWVLVTSAFHMPRALRSFRAAGWPELLPWPVDFRSTGFSEGIGWNLSGNLRSLETGLREHVGALAQTLLQR
jgi:uncharacterized SAM-binding protein YcdF (DUF218 family)